MSEAQIPLPGQPAADAVIAIPSTLAERKLNKQTRNLHHQKLEIPYGGDFLERMALYQGYDCTFNDAGAIKHCNVMQPLQGYLDPKRQQVVALLDDSVTKNWFAASKGAVDTQAAPVDPLIAPSDPPIIILSAGASSPNGDWEATATLAAIKANGGKQMGGIDDTPSDGGGGSAWRFLQTQPTAGRIGRHDWNNKHTSA